MPANSPQRERTASWKTLVEFLVVLQGYQRVRGFILKQRTIDAVERILELTIHHALLPVLDCKIQKRQPFDGWPSGSAHIGIKQTRRPFLSVIAVFWHFVQASARLLPRTILTRAFSAFDPA